MFEIFLSYRHVDSLFAADALHRRLCGEFGNDKVFMDAKIPLGINYRIYIREQLSVSKAMLVVIGDRWLTLTDPLGNRRIDDPEDMIRYEIKFAIDNSIPIIPIFLPNVSIPKSEELPEDIKPLIHMNGMSFNPGQQQDQDIIKLVKAIKDIIRNAQNDPDKDLLFQRLRNTKDTALEKIVNIYGIADVHNLSRSELEEKVSEAIRYNAGHTVANWFRGSHDLKYEAILLDVAEKLSSWGDWWQGKYKADTVLALEDMIWSYYNAEVKEKLSKLSDEEKSKVYQEIEKGMNEKGFNQATTTAVTASIFGAAGAVLGPVVAANIVAAKLTGFAAIWAAIFGTPTPGGAAYLGAGIAGGVLLVLPIALWYAGTPAMRKTIPAIIYIIQERKINEEINDLPEEYSQLKDFIKKKLLE